MKIKKLDKIDLDYIKECDKLFVKFMQSESKFDTNAIVLNEYGSFLKDLEEENKYMYVCIEDEKVVAFLYVYTQKNKLMKEEVAHFTYLFVEEEYRGKGIATNLLKTAIKDFKNIQLNVFSNNTLAVKLYEKLGFKPFYTNYYLKI